MQDQHAGDVGDFLKLGLLRWLATPSPFLPAHRLGMVRFGVSDDDRDADCKHMTYLDPSSAAGQDLRPLDPDLYDRLRKMDSTGNQSVAALAACGALPKGTLWFDQLVSLAALSPTERASLPVRRERWLHEAMAALAPCSLVFFDSDNSLRCDRNSVPSDPNPTDERTCLSEAGRLLERGQSVVTCRLAHRFEPIAAQVESTMVDMHDLVGVEPLAAVRASRGAVRLFTVIPHPQHRSDLEHRLGALQQSRWGDELQLYRWHPQKIAV